MEAIGEFVTVLRDIKEINVLNVLMGILVQIALVRFSQIIQKTAGECELFVYIFSKVISNYTHSSADVCNIRPPITKNCSVYFILACNCAWPGSTSTSFICDKDDGQCQCESGIEGRQCNACQSGYWNFPTCEPCQCNGHASACNTQTGECIGCKHNTTGFHCQDCLEGYYGLPTEVPGGQCIACNCDGNGSNQLCDENGQCHCKPGYIGLKCDSCKPGYFGFPNCKGKIHHLSYNAIMKVFGVTKNSHGKEQLVKYFLSTAVHMISK